MFTVLLVVGATVLVGILQITLLWSIHRGVLWLARTWTLRKPPRSVSDPGWISVWVIGVPLLIPVLLVAILGATFLVSRWVIVVAAVGGFLAYVGAWLLHGLPGHSRNLKYALFLLGSSMVPLLTVFGGGLREEAAISAVTAQFVASVVTLVIAVACVVAFRPDRPLAAGDASSRRTVGAWGVLSWIQGPDPLSILVHIGLSMTCVGGMAYLIARWCAKGRASRNSVVYLRSFHYDGAASVFGGVVVPAVHRTVPITGLVHTKQTDAVMLKSVPLLWRASFATIADAAWQKWVDANLSRALAVIVDVSVTTESVAWEIERVKRAVPAERILLMHRKDSAPPDSTGLPTIAYDVTTAAGVDAARRDTAGWLHRALAAFDPALATAPPRIAPPRWQIPMFLLLVCISVIPAAATSAGVAAAILPLLDDAKVQTANMSARNIATAAEMSMLRSPECPTPDGLVASGILSGAPRDPWGHEFRIECDPELVVRSPGADGLFDTPDDVASR